MVETIRTLGAEYTRDILAALSQHRETSSQDTNDQNLPVAEDVDRSVRTPSVVLDAGDLERVDGGNLILRNRANEAVTVWTVFVLVSHKLEQLKYAPNDLLEFEARGSISLALDPEGFVTAGYRSILGREVDEVGGHLYSNLIASGRLTHLEVLEILMTSEEAQASPNRILIVPGMAAAGSEFSNLVVLDSGPLRRLFVST